MQMHRRQNRGQLARRQFALRAAAALAAVSLLLHSGMAQAPGSSAQLTPGPTYTSDDGKSYPKFPNADVLFTLTGADGNPIAAKPGDLKLFEKGKEIGTATSIRTFEQTGYGITTILALDASGSMRGAPISAIHASIAKFVNQARRQDQVEVITFADDTRVDVPFGAGQSALTKELETVQARGRFTHLYDGLLDAMAKYNASQPKRHQLVVISDGHDEGSKSTIPDVVLKAKTMGVVIDSIGLTKDRGEYLVSLQKISKETGGTYRRAQSAQDLETLIGQGIQATRATPVAAFKTSHLPADGAKHSTQLRWQPGNLSATAFIQVPKGNVLSSLWLWGLGVCFAAGIILLAISWFGSKSSKSKPAPAAQFPGGMPAPPPMPPVPAGPFATGPAGFGKDFGEAGRTPTQPETGSHPYSTIDPKKYSSTAVEAEEHVLDPTSSRSRTQLAVFFEAPEQGPYARIQVRSGELVGTTVPVTEKTFNLGALEGNHLILPGDLTISGQHARLLWEESILKIEDKKSTNGTFVNSLRLAPGRHLLRPGDEIRIGQTVLVIERA